MMHKHTALYIACLAWGPGAKTANCRERETLPSLIFITNYCQHMILLDRFSWQLLADALLNKSNSSAWFALPAFRKTHFRSEWTFHPITIRRSRCRSIRVRQRFSAIPVLFNKWHYPRLQPSVPYIEECWDHYTTDANHLYIRPTY